MARSASRQQRVVVGLSGGVDSSVAAQLLLEQGFEVIGLFMKNWEEDDSAEYCSAAADLEDATRVCEKLGISLETINFSYEYWENVFRIFLEEYRLGRTPNPDILCNREIKFKEFFEYAGQLGADFMATGHYVRSQAGSDSCQLLKALDRNKDQSYFLYAVNGQALRKTLFPLGELCKPEVRARARKLRLVTHDKKDSTGICFIGERKFRNFLSTYLPVSPGEIRDEKGRRVGEHQGVMYYTIGQRQGLGIGGAGEPWYVAGKNVADNELLAVQGHDHPLLLSDRMEVENLHWISGSIPALPLQCQVKTRYRQPDQLCIVESLLDHRLQVQFLETQRAVTPGQSAVFYQGDVCLGGGVICNNGHMQG